MAIELATERRVAQPHIDEEVRSTELTDQGVPAPQHTRPVIGTETEVMAREGALRTDQPEAAFSTSTVVVISTVVAAGMIAALVGAGFMWVRAEPAIRRFLRNAGDMEIRVPLVLPVVGIQIARDLLAIRETSALETAETSPLRPARGHAR